MRTKTVRKNKKLILLISMVAILILALTAGTTLAWLKAQTGAVVNTFTPAVVTSQVEESIKDDIKSDVRIKNTSNIDAYIRAAVVINWVDKYGNIAAQQPVEDTDYKITYYDSNSGWWEQDGYYYYSSAVAPNHLTNEFIKECKAVGNAPEGYSLSVEIIADAIQSVPAEAVEDSWNVTVVNGAITAPSSSGN